MEITHVGRHGCRILPSLEPNEKEPNSKIAVFKTEIHTQPWLVKVSMLHNYRDFSKKTKLVLKLEKIYS